VLFISNIRCIRCGTTLIYEAEGHSRAFKGGRWRWTVACMQVSAVSLVWLWRWRLSTLFCRVFILMVLPRDLFVLEAVR